PFVAPQTPLLPIGLARSSSAPPRIVIVTSRQPRPRFPYALRNLISCSSVLLSPTTGAVARMPCASPRVLSGGTRLPPRLETPVSAQMWRQMWRDARRTKSGCGGCRGSSIRPSKRQRGY
ncbi:hypothetical protein FRC11_004987, partial [Ceratobasidium sp. 423]